MLVVAIELIGRCAAINECENKIAAAIPVLALRIFSIFMGTIKMEHKIIRGTDTCNNYDN